MTTGILTRQRVNAMPASQALPASNTVVLSVNADHIGHERIRCGMGEQARDAASLQKNFEAARLEGERLADAGLTIKPKNY